MKRFVIVSIMTIILLGCNVFAFSFVEQGLPKEPDHDMKWIMVQCGNTKYYFETIHELDEESIGNDYMNIDYNKLNNGNPVKVYEYDESNGWKNYNVKLKSIGSRWYKIEILCSNYDIPGRFVMCEPYLGFIRNCLNVSDVLAFSITIFSVLISVSLIPRIMKKLSGCSL